MLHASRWFFPPERSTQMTSRCRQGRRRRDRWRDPATSAWAPPSLANQPELRQMSVRKGPGEVLCSGQAFLGVTQN